ncbi:hypothetical protein PCANC_02997 [Puccinia coronata f. sp. avenae]|uniref:Telomere length regulation protein conserved domain-containing protein n=1 Tax=Puccinia coronata f. sp. avenae TaxID=200324 RepID=A0A2N5W171_9BASI|nr:hypothetical protein PCANC_02997 [Puccinia coronata f. sp. avenae]
MEHIHQRTHRHPSQTSTLPTPTQPPPVPGTTVRSIPHQHLPPTQQNHHHFLSAIWDQLINNTLTPMSHPSLSTLWQSIIYSLPRTELKLFVTSFLIHLQSRLPLHDHHDHHHHHHHQFSTQPHALAVERAATELLTFYFGTWGCENLVGTTDLFELVTEILTTTHGWTVATARWIARWASITKNDAAINARAFLAKSTLSAFASSHQIATGTASHHAFLLVLLLLTARPVEGQQQQQQQPSSTRSTSVHPRNVALDPVFVDAIQRSLSSLRPQFRLLGMLMAELITDFHRLPGSTKLDFGHNFDAVDDQENRLCVAIRQLSNHWSPAEQCPNHLWRDLLSSLTADHQTKLLTASSDHDQSPVPRDTPVETSTLPSPKLFSDPNELTLTELRLTRNENPRRKPVIEVLDSTPADASLEAYEIAEEDLESLYPPSGGQNGPPAASVLEPEFDYAQMKDQAPKPVYLSQLSQYLKDSDNFERVRIALIEAESLIKRKWDWGTELVEHALDLTHTLLNLQDQFDMDGFEGYRQAALVALIVAVPEGVGGCVIEQVFYHQYSVGQRLGMLQALVRAVLELAGPGNVAAAGVSPAPQNQKGFKKINAPPIHQLLLQYQGSQLDLPPSPLKPAALSSSVLLDQQPSSLEYLQQQPKPKWISHRLAAQRKGYGEQDDAREDRFEGRQVVRPGPMISQDVDERFLRIIVNRLGWYLDEFSRTGGGGGGGAFSGAGWMVLWEPLLVQKMVDTMRLLVFMRIARWSGAATTSGGLDGRTVETVKEVICLLLRMAAFLHAGTPAGDARADADVNTPTALASIVRLVLQLLSHLRPLPSSSLSHPPSSILSPCQQSQLPRLPHSAAQLHIDLLFHKLVQLAGPAAAPDTADHHLHAPANYRPTSRPPDFPLALDHPLPIRAFLETVTQMLQFV